MFPAAVSVKSLIPHLYRYFKVVLLHFMFIFVLYGLKAIEINSFIHLSSLFDRRKVIRYVSKVLFHVLGGIHNILTASPTSRVVHILLRKSPT